MAVVRTVTAYCDRPHCDRKLEIPSNTTQPWRELHERGWTLDLDLIPNEIATICPRHKGWAARQKS